KSLAEAFEVLPAAAKPQRSFRKTMRATTSLPPANNTLEAGSISHRKIDRLMATCLIAAGWLLVFGRLKPDWSINPQYYYGWVVPLLAFGLFYFRWTSRPFPSPPAAARSLALASSALLILLLPVRLIEEANPEWRLILWVHALQMVCLTLSALAYLGGWTW